MRRAVLENRAAFCQDKALISPDRGSLSYAALKNAADQAAERFPNRERAIAFILFNEDPSAVAVYLGALRSRKPFPYSCKEASIRRSSMC